MTLKLFAIYNKNYERVEGTWLSPTAGLAIRDNSQVLSRISPHFQEDLELREIGFFDDLSNFSSLPSPIVHSWEEWRQPEQPVDKPTK